MPIAAIVLFVLAATTADLPKAEQLVRAKQFAQAEAVYREILETEPESRAARLGLARVVLWQGRYREALALFDAIQAPDADSLEGHATAAYWSGDFRTAEREFRRLLSMDPGREFASRSLAEIASTMTPSERVSLDTRHDDQPLDGMRAEAAYTFFSDPLTRWSAAAGAYHLDAEALGSGSGEFARFANRTTIGRFTFAGEAGVFHFPDGVYRPVGAASVNLKPFTLSVEHREELAAATALRTHATSTTTALRWDHDREWIGSAEVRHQRWFDGNEGLAATAWAVAPFRLGRDWKLWAGASAAARDTDESRFTVTAFSSVRDGSSFRYSYRGEYDPYWTPNDLLEARAVLAIERQWPRATLKLQADGGFARDRGRAFGPDSGSTPFPPPAYPIEFGRTWRPFRFAATTSIALTRSLRLELGGEHGATVDYRSTSFHASLVRRH